MGSNPSDAVAPGASESGIRDGRRFRVASGNGKGLTLSAEVTDAFGPDARNDSGCAGAYVNRCRGPMLKRMHRAKRWLRSETRDGFQGLRGQLPTPLRRPRHRSRRGGAIGRVERPAAVSLRGCKRDRSASHLTDIPDHQDQVVGHPEVDRWCPLIEGDRQFGEDGVA